MNSLGFGTKPIFMPDATRGAVRALTTAQLKATGTDHIVVNTLHLLLSPGPERVAELGGIKKLMNYEGTALSDSGGYQVFSLLHSKKWQGKITKFGAVFKSPKDGRKHELTPEKSIEVQMMLDTDVMVVLDDCRDSNVSKKEAEIAVEWTLDWADKAKRHFLKLGLDKKGKLLSCVVQGARFPELREFCMKELIKIGFDGYNYGGVGGYVVDNKGELALPEMKVIAEMVPKGKFLYAMGVGRPQDIEFANREMGWNVFDTVIPTRNARHGTLYCATEPDGILRITRSRFAKDLLPIEKGCDCEACVNYSRAYIHHLLRNGEMTGMTLATIHNLRFYQRLMTSLGGNS
ncbi:tRNA guanosine(34) transglycosylase Tgt [bacterium]|nr:tRNA guanosine(34) transglycosylase Tgt [bacterium]